MKTDFTEEEYLQSRMRWYDYIFMYSWVVPACAVFTMTIGGLFGASHEFEVLGAKVFVIGLVILIILRGIILGDRVTRWKQEYKHLQD